MYAKIDHEKSKDDKGVPPRGAPTPRGKDGNEATTQYWQVSDTQM